MLLTNVNDVVRETHNLRFLKHHVMRAGGLVPGIVRWIDTGTDEVYDKIDFICRIMDFYSAFETDESRFLDVFENIVDKIKRLYRVNAVEYGKLFQEKGMVDYISLNGEELPDRITRHACQAWFDRLGQRPLDHQKLTIKEVRARYGRAFAIFYENEEGEEITYCTNCDTWRECSHEKFDAERAEANDEMVVCEECESDFLYCDYCCRYVVEGDWDSEYDRCYACAEECRDEESNYDNHELVDIDYKLYFFDNGENDKAEHYAFELEEGMCNSYDDWDDTIRTVYEEGEITRTGKTSPVHFYHFKSDCSIHGDYTIEVNTQPFTIEWFRNNKDVIDRMLCSFEEYFITGTEANAGLHFHVDADFFEDEDLYKIGCLLYKHHTWLKYVANRADWQMRKWADKFFINDDEPWKNAVYGWKRATDRYHAMNLLAIAQKHTVEFRFFNGTNDLDRLQANLEIIYAICHLAKQWKSLKREMKPENLLNYMKKHQCSEMSIKIVSNAIEKAEQEVGDMYDNFESNED